MLKNGKKRIFLDYASITPIDPRVVAEMRRIENNFWTNPASIHFPGESAKEVLDKARAKIAAFLQCRSGDIVFTSGGTESLNLAILGTVRKAAKKIKTPHIIVSTIEHPAVLEPVKFLLKEKIIEVSYVMPDQNGLINPDSIRREVKRETVLVIVQHANNEIGTIQSVREISQLIKNMNNRTKPLLLVDACQSALYENVSLERLAADFLVLDGIKLYGPRGIGLLVVRYGIELDPIIFGGGQEGGLRSGTPNVPAIAGLAKAVEIAVNLREKESKRLVLLRDHFINRVLKEIPGITLNGDFKNRLPNNINICFADTKNKIDSEFLVIKLDLLGFAVSAASACHNLNLENGSFVIESLGKKDCANASLRITLGRDTKKVDLDKLVVALKNIVC